jgi:hypothetical protein
MTEAQKLVDEFRTITAPGSIASTWKWAKRVTTGLSSLGKSTIGTRTGTKAIQVFGCADGSRFAFDMDGAKQVWAMPT